MKIFNEITKTNLEEIVKILDNDGLIIFPTDTVYGIACNAFSDNAIKKLFQAKNRSFDNPIGILTDSISKIDLVVKNMNKIEQDLINKYLPGNLTIIFNKKDNVSNLLTANKNTIGVRIPNNEIALKILEVYPFPLATTSVNISHYKAGTELNDFLETFKDKVDIIVDGGKTTSTPSTIVQVIDNKITILREGDLKITEK